MEQLKEQALAKLPKNPPPPALAMQSAGQDSAHGHSKYKHISLYGQGRPHHVTSDIAIVASFSLLAFDQEALSCRMIVVKHAEPRQAWAARRPAQTARGCWHCAHFAHMPRLIAVTTAA